MLLISVALARFIDDIALVSGYEHWFWVANLFAFAWYMGVGKAVLSFYPTISQADQPRLISSTWVLLQVVGLVSFALLWFLKDQWAQWLGLPALDYWWEAAVLSFMLIGGALLEYILVLRVAPKELLTWTIVAYTLLVTWLCYAIVYRADIGLFVNGFLLWYGLRWLYGAYLALSHGLAVSHVKVIGHYASLLVLQTLIAGGMAYVDGIIVNYSFDPDQFAIWRYGARELPLTVIFIAGISTAALPVLESGGLEAMHDLRDRLARLSKWLFPLVMVLMLVAPFAFVYVYGVTYKLSGLLFSTYLLITASRMLMPQVILQARLDNGIQVVVSIVEVIVNVVVSLTLLPMIGMVGIVFGSIVAFLVYKLVLIVLLQRRHGVTLADYLPVKLYSRSVISLVATYVIALCIYYYVL